MLREVMSLRVVLRGAVATPPVAPRADRSPIGTRLAVATGSLAARLPRSRPSYQRMTA
jgi:hypothetical protein